MMVLIHFAVSFRKDYLTILRKHGQIKIISAVHVGLNTNNLGMYILSHQGCLNSNRLSEIISCRLRIFLNDKMFLMDKDEIHNFYKNKASVAEQLSEPFQQEIIGDWLAYLGKQNDLRQWRCLDFGSGMGLNIATLKKFVDQIVVADVNTACLEKSKKKHGDKNLFYVLLKGKKLPFKKNYFDLVIATEVFEHITHFREAIKEIERVLKFNGFIILSTPNYFNLTGIIKKVKDRKNPRQMWGPWGGHNGGLERFTTWYSDERLLSRFRIIKRCGADYYKAWFNENPFVPFRIRKYITLWPGKLPFLKYLGMNYYLLGQK